MPGLVPTMSDVVELTAEARRACLAGTRMLILEECFDAITDLLIASKAVSAREAGVMLDSLASRLAHHASGQSDTDWAVHGPELEDQAARLATRAALMRVKT